MRYDYVVRYYEHKHIVGHDGDVGRLRPHQIGQINCSDREDAEELTAHLNKLHSSHRQAIAHVRFYLPDKTLAIPLTDMEEFFEEYTARRAAE